MQILQNLNWWQAILIVLVAIVAVLIPVYKSVGILPFKKKDDKPHDCPAGIKEQVCDIRDRTIRIETKVDSSSQALGTFRDNMLVLTGQITEVVKTIKEDLE